MRTLFQNIDPHGVADPEAGDAVRALWAAEDPSELGALVQGVLAGAALVPRCAVYDVFSYSQTTEGQPLAAAFDGLLATLVADARRTLERVRRERPLFEATLSAEMVASCLHVLWRAVEFEDAPRIERALREETHWRGLWPAVSATSLLRGLDAAFDRETAPLLAAIAERPDLFPLVRRLAIEALGVAAGPAELDLLAGLVARLPPPDAARAALILLDHAPAHLDVLKESARHWPESDDRRVRTARERIAEL